MVLLQGYGFTVSTFYDLLLEVRDQYTEILMLKWVHVFQKIFEEDDYTAILVRDEEEYYYIVSKFPYINEKLEKVRRCLALFYFFHLNCGLLTVLLIF